MTQPQPARHVLHVEEDEVLQAVESMEAGDAATRRTLLVERDSGRRVPHPPTRQLGAKGQVDILVVRKERLVEQADLAQHRRPVERRAAARAEDLLWVGV